MIIVEDYEAIRRAYYLEKKSIRQVAREQHHSRTTIRKAIDFTGSTHTVSVCCSSILNMNGGTSSAVSQACG